MTYSEAYKGFKTWKRFQPKQYKKVCATKVSKKNQQTVDFVLWLYSEHGPHIARKQADKFILTIAQQQTLPFWRVLGLYCFLRLLGWLAWDKKLSREVFKRIKNEPFFWKRIPKTMSALGFRR